MNFACLGWGSLVWDPRSLPVTGAWSKDGPLLPLEFARESCNGRMTLVIVDNLPLVPTLWATLAVTSMEKAIQALLEREGAEWIGSIGRWPLDRRSHRYAAEVGAWADDRKLDGVVWTDLKPGFRSERGSVPSWSETERHLASLTGDARKNAADYVFNAPAQIQTPFRAGLERLLR